MNHFIRVTSGLCLAAAIAQPGHAAESHVSQTQPVAAINNDHGLAIQGYDPVGYFADHRPEPGSPAITAQWQGATYRFASAAHRATFASDPSHYVPQYGGFCAFAMSRGRVAPIQPDHWEVLNDRLYLNNNLAAQQLWDRDRPDNIKVGDQNWPLIPKVALAAR